MMVRLPFDLESIEPPVAAWCAAVGTVDREWRAQDSGCISLGVRIDGLGWFFKFAGSPTCAAGLRSAIRFHAAVGHRAITPLAGSRELSTGPLLVYPWVDGDVLYDPVAAPGELGRNAPESPHRRFRALPPRRIIDTLDAILEAHVTVAEQGFVAVDLYDGCVVYDFTSHEVHLIDLDEYRPGPFRVTGDRLPGSTRFMAPEELQRGALIGEWTTVYNLGRMIEELGGGMLTPEACAVVNRATEAQPSARYQTVIDLFDGWRGATVGPRAGPGGVAGI